MRLLSIFHWHSSSTHHRVVYRDMFYCTGFLNCITTIHVIEVRDLIKTDAKYLKKIEVSVVKNCNYSIVYPLELVLVLVMRGPAAMLAGPGLTAGMGSPLDVLVWNVPEAVLGDPLP